MCFSISRPLCVYANGEHKWEVSQSAYGRVDRFVHMHKQGNIANYHARMQNTQVQRDSRYHLWWWAINRLTKKNAHPSDKRGKKIPFLTYSTEESSIEGSGQIGSNLLVMEVLDVKECPWPEPSEKLNPGSRLSSPRFLSLHFSNGNGSGRVKKQSLGNTSPTIVNSKITGHALSL